MFAEFFCFNLKPVFEHFDYASNICFRSKRINEFRTFIIVLFGASYFLIQSLFSIIRLNLEPE